MIGKAQGGVTADVVAEEITTDMSKVPHPFVTESMELLGELTAKDRAKVWFIHMNHTNPLLNPESKESKSVQNKGFNIAVEGIRLTL